eukprot:s406_g6.t2
MYGSRYLPASLWQIASTDRPLTIRGTALFVGPNALAGAFCSLGDVMELGSAALFAVQMWRCEKLIRQFPESQVAALTCLQLAFVSGLSFVCVLAQGSSPESVVETVSAFPPGEWLQVVIMGLVTTAFCLWAEARALRDVDAPIAALIYACEPIWGAVFAYLWRGEMPDGPCAVYASAYGAAKADLVESLVNEMFTEIPIVVTASPLAECFLLDWSITNPLATTSQVETLDVENQAFFEKNVQLLSSSLANLAEEQTKMAMYERNAGRKGDDKGKGKGYRTQQPQPLDTMVLSKQIQNYCKAINNYAGDAFSKVYLVSNKPKAAS